MALCLPLPTLLALSLQISASPARARDGRDSSYSRLASDSSPTALFLWAKGAPAAGLDPLAVPSEAPAGSAPVDLLAWLKSKQVAQFPDQGSVRKYNRLLHFGGWAKHDNGCQDTRALALIRDAKPGSIAFTNEHNCSVATGDWIDPYTNDEFTTAKSVQIDHVVPLRHAYYAGAYQWHFAQRCNYANFLSNPTHLLSVSGHENMSKGDKGPDGYLPPASSFRCAYVGIWMKIKAVWDLAAEPGEIQAIEQVSAQLGCDAATQTISKRDLEDLRQAAASIIRACDRPDPEDKNDGPLQASDFDFAS